LTSADMTTWQAAARSVRGAAFTPVLPGWFADESAGGGQVEVGRSAPPAGDGTFLRISVTPDVP